ncbi:MULTISPECIES: helix-turn-helix domain-containing protein [Rathayibacter]|uniref:XRE family transcriptional regulator n=2 Tax=Rathayibacter iranicus TaxID=59737 RepID=A0AAD1ADE1_9MICO|nr:MULTISPECIES: helix-turn-helix transcriptional regulator [Rathayibacter]AZZ55010.1 XRE family transcriptional regulator [Rathayibacter iranicus]MWV32265.1 helix-turn-helix domain-containing protein [Rathayibacter iranicus NCPPB 2253 = VKM Ac-1602]PPF18971.1 XRE family transcriptional regulator [Rathayibacter sp. AY1A7]PPH83457.1 XRE family transcriptional regulator [Rathayibacter sp. AY1D9]PPI62394.1 XRE family transcriptional regulator [Rathayibacter iranicus]
MTAIEMTWNLRQLMAQKGLFKTTDLVPLLSERGVQLSREQIYRLVTSKPARLNMDVFGALCDILDCSPAELVTFTKTGTVTQVAATAAGRRKGPSIGDLRPIPATIRRAD